MRSLFLFIFLIFSEEIKIWILRGWRNGSVHLLHKSEDPSSNLSPHTKSWMWSQENEESTRAPHMTASTHVHRCRHPPTGVHTPHLMTHSLTHKHMHTINKSIIQQIFHPVSDSIFWRLLQSRSNLFVCCFCSICFCVFFKSFYFFLWCLKNYHHLFHGPLAVGIFEAWLRWVVFHRSFILYIGKTGLWDPSSRGGEASPLYTVERREV